MLYLIIVPNLRFELDGSVLWDQNCLTWKSASLTVCLLRVAVQVKSYPLCPFIEAKPSPVIIVPPNCPWSWKHSFSREYYRPVPKISVSTSWEIFNLHPLILWWVALNEVPNLVSRCRGRSASGSSSEWAGSYRAESHINDISRSYRHLVSAACIHLFWMVSGRLLNLFKGS